MRLDDLKLLELTYPHIQDFPKSITEQYSHCFARYLSGNDNTLPKGFQYRCRTLLKNEQYFPISIFITQEKDCAPILELHHVFGEIYSSINPESPSGWRLAYTLLARFIPSTYKFVLMPKKHSEPFLQQLTASTNGHLLYNTQCKWLMRFLFGGEENLFKLVEKSSYETVMDYMGGFPVLGELSFCNLVQRLKPKPYYWTVSLPRKAQIRAYLTFLGVE